MTEYQNVKYNELDMINNDFNQFDSEYQERNNTYIDKNDNMEADITIYNDNVNNIEDASNVNNEINKNTEEYMHGVPLEVKPCKNGVKVKTMTVNPWLLFLIFNLSFIAMNWYVSAIKIFIEDNMFGDSELNAIHNLIIAVFFSGVLILVAWLAGIPLVTFSKEDNDN